jgi:hypothetical protein
MRRKVKIMKTKILFALFITVAVLLSGCGKANPKLAAENADLKARVQKLEQQLQASKAQTAPVASQAASIQDLKSQLDEAQKKAEADANQLKLVSSLVETQKVNIDDLMGELSRCQQATEKADKALKLYQDKALRSALADKPVKPDSYHQNYLAARTAVTKLAGALPESQVRRQILGVLAVFTRVNDVWEAAALEMQARTKGAQADYNQFVNFGGLGPNDVVINMGKTRILAPAEQKNAVTASSRDQQMVSFEKDIDLGIKNLQALVSGQRT